MLAEMLPPAFGGAARQALHLAAELRRQDVHVFFLAAQTVPTAPRTDTINGFPVFRVPHAPTGKWTKFRGLLASWCVFWKMRRDFDVLHLHSAHYLTLAAAAFAKFILRKPLVIKLTSIASDIPSAILRRSYPRFTWWLYRQADAWVCMTPAQREDCRQHGLPADRIHLIPNGVDTARFRPLASVQERAELLQKLGLDATRRYVVFIGTLEKDKGVELLVESAATVCRQAADVTFLLIGPDGSGTGEQHVRPEFVTTLREKIQTLGLTGRVELLGQRANVEDYLRVATVFVFPSRSEGFGSVLIEALASGVPCVAHRIAGVTDQIVEPGIHGALFDREDAGQLAELVLRYAGPDANAQRVTVPRQFELPVVAAKYGALYRQVTGSSWRMPLETSC